jgi:hypothetical protein
MDQTLCRGRRGTGSGDEEEENELGSLRVEEDRERRYRKCWRGREGTGSSKEE